MRPGWPGLYWVPPNMLHEPDGYPVPESAHSDEAEALGTEIKPKLTSFARTRTMESDFAS